MAKITNPTAAERQAEVRQRLLLALKVVTGRRHVISIVDKVALSTDELALLGIHDSNVLPYVVFDRCETILVEAILAGGYY